MNSGDNQDEEWLSKNIRVHEALLDSNIET